MKKGILITALVLLFSVEVNADETGSLWNTISEHLSYLGYECIADGEKLTARHSIKPGFDIHIHNNGILFRAWFKHRKTAETDFANYVVLINHLNRFTTTLKYYCDSEKDLVLTAWYPLPYDKSSFSSFVAAWETDFVSSTAKNKMKIAQYIQ